jgi:RNA polymerase sigma-70 factor (ECF subfamily)
MESAAHSQEWFIDQVREHQARLRASIRALGVRAEAVDDIAQDVFVIAWQKMTDFGPGGDFGLWVIEIARRLVANERRKEARQRRILAGEVTDRLLQISAETDGPMEQLARDEELGALQTCLEGLPSNSRQMIRWRYFDQFTPGAIAGLVGLTPNNVRQSLLRLRRVLLQCVEKRLLCRER